ncbi:hypothetical protein [Desulfatiglans anilini]|uniref:hypothetical protein n=1 Tax=Desulfatiglans anilini TaxID=90728 RepID=UPI000417C373|nr:hypothetical protein [Desulfatiglans anilini]
MMKAGITDRVRAAAKKLGKFRAADIGTALAVKEYGELKQIRSAIRELRKAGEIECVEPGVYRCLKIIEGSPVRRRIFRAMHVRGTFSVRDLVLLTDADSSYVRSVIRKLIQNGALRVAGDRPAPSGARERTYQVGNRDRFFLDYVKEAS